MLLELLFLDKALAALGSGLDRPWLPFNSRLPLDAVLPGEALGPLLLPYALLALGPFHPNALLALGPFHPNALFALWTLHPNPLLALGPLRPNALLTLGPLHPNRLLALGPLHPNALFALWTLHPNPLLALWKVNPLLARLGALLAPLRASFLGFLGLGFLLGFLGAFSVSIPAALGLGRSGNRERRNGGHQNGPVHR